MLVYPPPNTRTRKYSEQIVFFGAALFFVAAKSPNRNPPPWTFDPFVGFRGVCMGGAQDCCSKASDGGSPGDFLRAGKCLMDLKRLEEARVALGRAR